MKSMSVIVKFFVKKFAEFFELSVVGKDFHFCGLLKFFQPCFLLLFFHFKVFEQRLIKILNGLFQQHRFFIQMHKQIIMCRYKSLNLSGNIRNFRLKGNNILFKFLTCILDRNDSMFSVSK